MALREPFRVPLFVVLVSVAMALIGLAFASAFFLAPAKVLQGADIADPAVARLAFSMGTGSLAMALALLIALGLRSRGGLIAALTMRALTESFDLYNTLGLPEASSAVPLVAVMIAAELIAIGLLIRAAPTTIS